MLNQSQISVTDAKASHSIFIKSILCALLCLSYSHKTYAKKQAMYIYEDKNGRALLTNRKPRGRLSRYSKQVKVTWYKDTNVHEYKDWGKTEYAVPTRFRGNRNRFDGLIAQAANRYGIDPALMKAIMHTESGFNPRARSPVGAQGLMQLMPPTARDMGVRNPWDPAQNINGAAKYLRYLTKLFNGNKRLILAGYNAGQGNVKKYGGVPPFKETQNYVRKVLSRYNSLYRNKSFTVRSGKNNSQRHGQNMRVVSANPIQKYRKNNTNYIRTSAKIPNNYKRRQHFQNQAHKNRVPNHGSLQDKNYSNSAYNALRNGRKK